MDEGIQFTANLVKQDFGQLDPREEAILIGSWNKWTYEQIKNKYSERFSDFKLSYIKKGLGYELWKKVTSSFKRANIIPSDLKIHKENFKSIIERIELSNLPILENLSPGEVLFNRYEITQISHQDKIRKVYIAKHLNYFNQPCVIERISTTSSANQQTIVTRQATILRDAASKTVYIPKLFAWFKQDNFWNLIYEWIEGVTLSQELSLNPPKTEDEVKKLLNEILEILVCLQQCSIIHRNISPDSLIRRNIDKKLILVNFNNAKYVGRFQSTLAQFKIDSYAAPEFIYNPTFASDLYSVGKSCIQALTGVAPEQCRMNNYNWQEHVSISSEFAKILDKMVDKDYEKRYQSAREILEIL